MKSYETVSEALNDLIKRGYTHDFNIHTEEECLVCNNSLTQLSPDDFEIDEKCETNKTNDFNAYEYAIYAHLSCLYIWEIRGKIIEFSQKVKNMRDYAGIAIICGSSRNMRENMRSHNRIFPGGLNNNNIVQTSSLWRCQFN